MNRAAFESRLQELLDARRAPSSDTELLRAAEQNPELKQLLFAFELFGSVHFPAPEASPELAARVVTELRQAPVQRLPATLPAWFAPLAAVAATLLVATTIAFLAQDRQAAEIADTESREQTPIVAGAAVPPQAAPSLDRLTRQAADNYRELAATTGESWTSALSVVQSGRPNPETAPTARSREDWLRAVPSGLRPLSNSTSGAVFSLMRAVPGTNHDAQDEL